MSWWALIGSFVAILALAGLVRLWKLGHAALDDEAGVRRIAQQLLPDFPCEQVVRDSVGESALLFGPKGVAFVKLHGAHFVAQRLGDAPPFRRDLTVVSVGLEEALYGPCVVRLDSERAARDLTRMLQSRR